MAWKQSDTENMEGNDGHTNNSTRGKRARGFR